MIGAIAGDIIGSVYEFEGIKLTIAAAEKLLGGGDYATLYRKWAGRYPATGYGGRFSEWLQDDSSGPTTVSATALPCGSVL